MTTPSDLDAFREFLDYPVSSLPDERLESALADADKIAKPEGRYDVALHILLLEGPYRPRKARRATPVRYAEGYDSTPHDSRNQDR